ncbi:uncharacterized protein LOC121487102 [Vulpes lagopus]|uniref:uncharacterized protein LOC121487102 n=1 Tax=Vulpes lagopus TaxID=494514 RepID=UPI001BCA0777|nr:uncharacterized protein LOC121487102 [Vulpes lagopus]
MGKSTRRSLEAARSGPDCRGPGSLPGCPEGRACVWRRRRPQDGVARQAAARGRTWQVPRSPSASEDGGACPRLPERGPRRFSIRQQQIAERRQLAAWAPHGRTDGRTAAHLVTPAAAWPWRRLRTSVTAARNNGEKNQTRPLVTVKLGRSGAGMTSPRGPTLLGTHLSPGASRRLETRVHAAPAPSQVPLKAPTLHGPHPQPRFCPDRPQSSALPPSTRRGARVLGAPPTPSPSSRSPAPLPPCLNFWGTKIS